MHGPGITGSGQAGRLGEEMASQLAQRLGDPLGGKAGSPEIARGLDPEFNEARESGMGASGDAEGTEGILSGAGLTIAC